MLLVDVEPYHVSTPVLSSEPSVTVARQLNRAMVSLDGQGGREFVALYKKAVWNLLCTSFPHIHPDTRLVTRFFTNVSELDRDFQHSLRGNTIRKFVAAFSSADKLFDFVDTERVCGHNTDKVFGEYDDLQTVLPYSL